MSEERDWPAILRHSANEVEDSAGRIAFVRLTAGEARRIASKIDALRAHLSTVPEPEWMPIETAPASGYFMVYEDGAYRLRLRQDGKWLDTAYAGIECAPWGDVAVGQDAQRILDMRAASGTLKLVVRDGCCENPTHWMPLPAAPKQENSHD